MYYFAYGMNTAPSAMGLRCGIDNGPIAVGAALLEDYEFRFAGPADVVHSPGRQVHGVLWLLNQEHLDALDQREGYPYYYDRQIVTVSCENSNYDAWVYYMLGGRLVYPDREPSSYYYDMLTEGYTHFGLPLSQIT